MPLLAIIPLMAAQAPEDTTTPLEDFAIAIAAVAALFAAGRYLLNPLFQVIARTGARDVMIAAALLVVMGAATMMQLAGLSMAMGAFLAGVLLAESSYRHELEADIEPFRGILQALFFMAVGLSLELQVVAENLLSIIIAVPVLMLVKSLVLYDCAGLPAHAITTPSASACFCRRGANSASCSLPQPLRPASSRKPPPRCSSQSSRSPWR